MAMRVFRSWRCWVLVTTLYVVPLDGDAAFLQDTGWHQHGCSMVYETPRRLMSSSTLSSWTSPLTNGFDRAALWLFKYMSPLTPFRNPIATDLVSADLMDTSDDLAYIIKDLSIQFPGVMADGAFARVDTDKGEDCSRE
jgi:hypothetical protein